jgi:hypothetical protein
MNGKSMRGNVVKIFAGLLAASVLWSCDTTDSPEAVPVSSIPGVSWRDFRVGTSPNLMSVVWTGTQLVAVGEGIWTSPNGDVWTKRYDTQSSLLKSVIWTGDQLVAVGENSHDTVNSAVILTSPDGMNWTPRSSSLPQIPLNEVTWTGSVFLAVGGVALGHYSSTEFRAIVLSSPDGATWTTRANTTGNRFEHVLWTGTQFVVTGTHSIVKTSPDGTTWTQRFIRVFSGVGAMIRHGSQIVAGGEDEFGGLIWTSPDGITWTSTRQTVTAEGLAWGDSLGVAVGYRNLGGIGTGALMTSPDGVGWTERATGEVNTLNAVTWTGDRFVAVGSYGAVLISPP